MAVEKYIPYFLQNNLAQENFLCLVKKSLVLSSDPDLDSPISLDPDPNSADLDSQQWLINTDSIIHFFITFL
jgi:hypothetical protein